MSQCESCSAPAKVYAMGIYAGDWGGYYCLNCIPKGFMITDRIEQERATK
jgi:hypothetical protein